MCVLMTNIFSPEEGRIINNCMIEITDKAIEVLLDKTKGRDGVRIGIIPSGCNGWKYNFDYLYQTEEDDHIIDYGKFKVAVDKLSAPHIEGMTLDYIEEGLNSWFDFINPHTGSKCGCGESFTINGLENGKFFSVSR